MADRQPRLNIGQRVESIVASLLRRRSDRPDANVDAVLSAWRARSSASPLCRAVVDGKVDTVIRLLDEGNDVNLPGHHAHAPLHLASLWEQQAIGRCLLDHGADPNAPDPQGRLPLCLAIRRRQSTLIAALLSHAVDVTRREPDGTTALHLAMAAGDSALTRALLERGADPSAPDAQGLTPIARAADAAVLALGLGDTATPQDISALVDGQIGLGVALHRACAQPGTDQCSAPIGAAMALMVLWAAARGETQREIAAALRLPAADADRLHAAAAALSASLLAPGIELTFASALFADEQLEIDAAFVTLLARYYRGELHAMSFADPVRASETINAWVAQRTRGLIDRIVSRDDFVATPASIPQLVLANALFFKGRWVHPFKPSDTETAPFTQLDGTSAPTSLMHATMRATLVAIEGGRALELPYVGGALSMVVLLPERPDGLPAMEAALPRQVHDWLERVDAHSRGPFGFDEPIEVYLPRFRVESTLDLTGSLRTLGIMRALSPDSADFSGVAPRMPQLGIRRFAQRVFVEVDEAGTTAAAATVGMMYSLGGPPKRPPVFRADHPFLFLIRDRRSGAGLFLGRVVNAPPPRG
jgi:serpin B